MQIKQDEFSLIQGKVICPSKSPDASKMTVIRKQDGTARMCVDYQKLNSQIEKKQAGEANINEFLDRIAQNTFLTILNTDTD